MKATPVLGFQRYDLGPGMRLFVCPSPKFKTLSIRAYFHRTLARDATSIALLPAVLRRGCAGWPTMRSISLFLEDLYGASFGTDVIKMGEQHVITFSIEAVNDRFAPTKTGVLEKAVGFLASVMTKPLMKPESVEQEKENLKRRIEGLINERGAYAFEKCIQKMCPGEAYAIYELGWVEDLPEITPAELERKHRETLATAPLELFVLGDVEPATVARVFASKLKLKRGAIATPSPAAVMPAPPQPREALEKLPVEQGKLVIGARSTVTWADEDVFALSFANGVLGGFPHSKLFANVREKAGLAYSVHSSLDHAKGLLFITAGIDADKYGKAVAMIKEQLWNLQQGFVTKDEMEKTRASLIARIRAREDSPGATIGVLHEMLTLGALRSREEIIKRYEAMSRQHVARAASKVALDTIYFLAP